MDLLKLLLKNGYTPVLSVPILDETGIAVSTENDDILTLLQEKIQAEIIIQFIEAPGFLENKDDEESLVKFISKENLARRENQVEGRMKRKILALRKLLNHDVGQVILADGRRDHPLKDALAGEGTRLQ